MIAAAANRTIPARLSTFARFGRRLGEPKPGAGQPQSLCRGDVMKVIAVWETFTAMAALLTMTRVLIEVSIAEGAYEQDGDTFPASLNEQTMAGLPVDAQDTHL